MCCSRQRASSAVGWATCAAWPYRRARNWPRGAPTGGGSCSGSLHLLSAACPARDVRSSRLSFDDRVHIVKFRVGAECELRPHRARKRTGEPRRLFRSREKLLADSAAAFRNAIEMAETAGYECEYGAPVVWSPFAGDAFFFTSRTVTDAGMPSPSSRRTR